MVKKIICIILIITTILLASLYFVGNYFYNSVFKRDLSIARELVETQEESVNYRSVDYLKAEKWWNSLEKETLEITSFDGLKLKAFFVSAKEKTDKVVILAHSEEGSASTMAAFAQYYYNEGFNILVPDNRSFRRKRRYLSWNGIFR